MKRAHHIFQYVSICLLACTSALNYAIFIFPNRFAPAGIDGICTMLQDLSGINIGYFSLLVNIPLIILALAKLNRDYAVKSTVFILVFSSFSTLLGRLDISAFLFHTETSTSVVLAPVAAGVIRGIIYAITIRLNGSSGGIDIVAALIHRKAPHFNLMNIIFAMNIGVAICSYFVYGNHLEPVICGILYFYITSHTSTHIQSSRKENTKIEIITSDAELLYQEITRSLPISATILDSHGAYSGSANKMIVCIAKKKYLPQIKDTVTAFPDAIYFVSMVADSNAHFY